MLNSSFKSRNFLFNGLLLEPLHLWAKGFPYHYYYRFLVSVFLQILNQIQILFGEVNKRWDWSQKPVFWSKNSNSGEWIWERCSVEWDRSHIDWFLFYQIIIWYKLLLFGRNYTRHYTKEDYTNMRVSFWMSLRAASFLYFIEGITDFYKITGLPLIKLTKTKLFSSPVRFIHHLINFILHDTELTNWR